MGKQHGLWALIAALLLTPFAASSGAVAQGPPAEESGCLAYAFTRSSGHAFLLESNSTVYGSEAFVVHNCGNVTVSINGTFAAQGETGLRVPLPAGMMDFRVESQGLVLIDAYSVESRPDRLEWEYEWQVIQENKPISVDPNHVAIQQNWAAGLTALIVWVLSVQVFWHLVNAFVQRNYVEEVL